MIALLFWFAELILSGQDAVKIKRITVPVEFDGIPQESAWQSLDLFPLTMHKPNFGGSAFRKK